MHIYTQAVGAGSNASLFWGGLRMRLFRARPREHAEWMQDPFGSQADKVVLAGLCQEWIG